MRIIMTLSAAMLCPFLISACRTTGSENSLRDSEVAEEAATVPCPYGVGVDATTGQYMSCQCPETHPRYDRTAGVCTKQSSGSNAVLTFDVKCQETGVLKAPAIRSLSLNFRAESQGQPATVEATGATRLKTSSANPTFKMTASVQKLTNAEQADRKLFFAKLAEDAKIVLQNGVSVPLDYILFNPKDGTVGLREKGKSGTPGYRADGCTFSEQSIQALNELSQPGQNPFVREN